MILSLRTLESHIPLFHALAVVFDNPFVSLHTTKWVFFTEIIVEPFSVISVAKSPMLLLMGFTLVFLLPKLLGTWVSLYLITKFYVSLFPVTEIMGIINLDICVLLSSLLQS